MHGCCMHKMGKDTIRHSLGNQSLYSRPYYVEAAVIIAIMLIQFRKKLSVAQQSPFSQSCSSCGENNATMSGA